MFFPMPLTSLNTEVLAYLLISIDFESDFFPVCSFLVPDIPPQDFKGPVIIYVGGWGGDFFVLA